MTAKLNMVAALSNAHAAGIFSDMTVDGPIIGTLVAIIDRARNLPNKRTMGKQDPYCAARLGKEAKKTATDKRGGQTPRWDQELRFTVHDSPDYHRLKVSVFNDDKKTELIGETWVNLEAVITNGGGQSDDWHGLNCKGKYAGEIRIELTYYDTRPKADKPVAEKRRETSHPDAYVPPAAIGGPRESKPIKRRPLPSDPTAVSPSPLSAPEHRGLQGMRAGPRELGSPRHRQEQPPARRPVPDPASAPVSSHNTPQRQQDPRTSNGHLPQHNTFDMSYAAPKPYEVQPVEATSQRIRDGRHSRPASQEDFRASRGHIQPHPAEPSHAHSAPVVPTQRSYEHDQYSPDYGHDFDDASYHVAPLRSSRSNTRVEQAPPAELYQSNSYNDMHSSYDQPASHRRQSAMQPTVEDEDFDLPPPPPVHRKNATTLPHKHQHSHSTSYSHEPQQPSYDLQRQSFVPSDFDHRQPGERRYTHPRGGFQQPSSRPVSRDTMAPSPLRQETSVIPASLLPGYDASRHERDYQTPPSYETPQHAPQRLRQYSEPVEYAPPQYTTPIQAHELVHYQAQPAVDSYYAHDPPEQPRQRSPMHDHVPIVRPRATSPAVSPRHSPNPMDERSSRMQGRSMPTRKSVSPRPPPPDDYSERRLSGVPFGPDDFNVLNPTLTKPSNNSDVELERPGSSMEFNDKGQIVTFSGRVVDASDHLPIDNWAPEPEPKGTVKEKAPRNRAQLNGSRGIEDAKQREERYRRDRAERDRIRNAADVTFGSADMPSNALVTTRHDFNARPSSSHSTNYPRPSSSHAPSSALVLADDISFSNSVGRNRMQQRSSPLYDRPDTHVLRERHNPNSYGSGGGGMRAPPIPAKIPLDERMQYEDAALSLELQSIDIGPGTAGRRPRTQARRTFAH